MDNPVKSYLNDIAFPLVTLLTWHHRDWTLLSLRGVRLHWRRRRCTRLVEVLVLAFLQLDVERCAAVS